MKPEKKERRGLLESPSFLSILASVICIVIGLIAGLIVLFIINPEHAMTDGFIRLIKGGFYDFPYGVGKVLSNAAPLIMTGLSVGFAFKTGLFNIGVAGQYTLGAFGALYFAIVLQMPWYVCLLAATVFGAFWGAIPGIFKAYLNVNEVITSIMFNWIGLYAVNEIMYGGGKGLMYDSKSTKTFSLRNIFPDSVIPDLGLSKVFQLKSVTIAIFLAVLVAILIYVVLNKTIFGYELKACGHNKFAAQYAGISDKRNIILSMVIAGALAGFGAGLFYLSGVAEWNPQNSTALPTVGWNGIPVALLAASNPIGTIFAALFISHITVGGTYLNTSWFPKEIADVITAIVIYLCAFVLLFKHSISSRFSRKRDSGGDGEEPEGPVETVPGPEAAGKEGDA